MKIITVLLLTCLLLTGCGINTPPAAESPLTETNPTEMSSEAPVQMPTEETAPPLLTFTLYFGNENADGFLTTQVEVTEINESVVLEKMKEAGVLPENVEIITIASDGSQLKIDVNRAFYDHLRTMATSGEMILMGSVVNTFLNAYQAESVFLTCEGEIMESGHMVYDFPMEYFA